MILTRCLATALSALSVSFPLRRPRPFADGTALCLVLVVTVSLALAATAHAADGVRVAAEIGLGADSDPEELTPVGDKLYFVANDVVNGEELWVHDTATGTTTLVRDIRPGTGSSYVGELTELGGKLYFRADDGEEGSELWVHDPGAGTTIRVTDISPYSWGSSPQFLTPLGGKLYFRADDGSTGSELWVHDPTGGTVTRVADILQGNDGSYPENLTALGGKLYFQAADGFDVGSTGQELWVHDPGASTTTRVADIRPGSSGSMPQYLTPLDGKLYFQADDGSTGQELWVHDPGAVTTTRVADVYPGTSSSGPVALTPYGTKLYFRAYAPIPDRPTKQELWVHDTVAGTTTWVSDIQPTSIYSNGGDVIAFSGKIYFTTTNGTGEGQKGEELYVHDPEGGSTTLVKDINDGPLVDSSPSNFTVLGDRLFFTAYTDASGNELWVHDPLAGTTTMVQDIYPGTSQSSPRELTVLGGKLYFRANDGTAGNELRVYDPNEASTALVANVRAGTKGSDTAYLAARGGKIYFEASDGKLGKEPWVYDPVARSATLVADIRVGPSWSNTDSQPRAFTEVGGKVYFRADDGITGTELWVYDPAVSSGPSNPTRVADIRSGPSGSSPQLLTPLGGKLYFAANDGIVGIELWVYNPEVETGPSNPTWVADIYTGSSGSSPQELTILDGKLYFRAYTWTYGYELWFHDPVMGDTSLVHDIRAGDLPSTPKGLTPLGGKLYFSAYNDANGQELWVHDPAIPSSTSLVWDIRTGSASGMSFSYSTSVVVEGKLYFAANEGTNGLELWVYDPAVPSSASNPSLVTDIAAGSGSSTPTNLTSLGGKLYFSAYTGEHGIEPWVHDPVAGTTTLLADINSGAYPSIPAELIVHAGKLYFVAHDDTYDRELYVHDPTAGTTTKIDIYTGQSSTPQYLTELDGSLYFAAKDLLHEPNKELFVIGANAAPVLDNSQELTLDAIAEDDVSSAGTLVSDILASREGFDPISDTDGDPDGIAVVGVDSTDGTFEYALDGTSFTSFGTVSDGSARLLKADAYTRIRFVPAPNFGGTATLTFRAWDQSSGTAGQTANAGTNGGSTAFSAATGTVRITVTPVNDPARIEGLGGTLAFRENDPDTILAPAATVTDPNDGGSTALDGGSLAVEVVGGALPGDRLGIASVGAITTSGNEVMYNATTFGTFSGGANENPLVVAFDSNASLEAAQALVRAITYGNSLDYASDGTLTIELILTDGEGAKSRNGLATYRAQVAQDGPVAVWRFESDTVVVDSIGTATGIYDGSVRLPYGGPLGEATARELRLSGTGWATIPDSSALDRTDSFMIEAWVNPSAYTSTDTRAAILVKEGAYGLALAKDTGALQLAVNTGSGLTDWQGTKVVPIGTWTHVAVSFLNGTARVYMNGAFAESLSMGGNAAVSSLPLFIGAESASSGFFLGGIAEVALYSAGPSGGRIKQHFRETKAVEFTSVNDAPVIGGVSGTSTYTEGGSAQRLAPQASVSDADGSPEYPEPPDFSGGSLTVSITANGESGDRLGIATTAQVWVVGGGGRQI